MEKETYLYGQINLLLRYVMTPVEYEEFRDTHEPFQEDRPGGFGCALWDLLVKRAEAIGANEIEVWAPGEVDIVMRLEIAEGDWVCTESGGW